MCPDRDLISAYVDGEVPSPWRERLEEHIASCPSCASLSASYTSLSRSLRAESDPNEAAALARGRARLDALLDEIPASSRRRASGFSWGAGDWKRSVSLPLPFAAAAAILVILLGGATALLAFKPAHAPSMPILASSELNPQIAKPASMEELIRYLNSSEGQVQLTINLPAGTTFGSAGKPVIMRSDQVMPAGATGEISP